MPDEKKPAPKVDFPLSVMKLWKQVQTNTESELKDLASAEAKFTRKTGMDDPDLDVGTTPYDASETSKKKA
jgi:peroxiredoxin